MPTPLRVRAPSTKRLSREAGRFSRAVADARAARLRHARLRRVRCCSSGSPPRARRRSRALRGRVAEERGEDMVAIADRAFLLHYRTDTAVGAAGGDRRHARPVCGASFEDGSEQRAPVVVVVVGPPPLGGAPAAGRARVQPAAPEAGGDRRAAALAERRVGRRAAGVRGVSDRRSSCWCAI